MNLNNDKIRFALIGCGRISKRHSDLLGNNQIKGATLTAVCDIVESRAKEIGDLYKVPYFTDMHEMMTKMEKDIDVISILTESGNHAAHTIDLAKYKKHIVVEKPMALTLDHADAMIKACDENGIRLFVVKQNRYNLPVIKLKEAISKNRFGKLFLATVRVRWCRPQDYYDQAPWRGTWALDGGVIANQASHHVDLLTYLMGEVDAVYAKGIKALANIEAEDTAAVIFKFKNGGLGILEATTAARPKDLEGSISILGENGTVEIGGFAVNEMKTWSFKNQTPDDELVIKNYSVNPPSVYGFGHQKYLENVVESINSGKSALVDGLEGRKSLEIISAIYESMESREEVFLRFKPKVCRLGEKL